MQDSDLYSDGFVEFNKKLTRLGFVAKSLHEGTAKKIDEEIDSAKMELEGRLRCRGDNEDNPSLEEPQIKDLCPADRERIALLVTKLAECTAARKKAESELAEIRSENESLISRYEIRCNQHEIEKSQLKEQLDTLTSRGELLKEQSSRSLDALGEQLNAQEAEFVKLTETVRDLLREKIQLQNALIERESRVKIAEAKLDRAKETLEMEKLLFIKERVKDSMIRPVHNQACQTLDHGDVNTMKEKSSSEPNAGKNAPIIKHKDDLEDPSSDGILLRSLFFKSNTYDDHDNSPINLLYH